MRPDAVSSEAAARSFSPGAECTRTLPQRDVIPPIAKDCQMTTHKGKCFCGSVEIEVQGAPEGMGYCHCSSCRSWSAAPVNAFTLWKPQNVRVTKGAEYLGKFAKTEMSNRQYCKRCGGHLMTDHPPLGDR